MKVVLALPEGYCNVIAVSSSLSILEAVNVEYGGFFDVSVGRMRTCEDIVMGRFKIDVDVELDTVDRVDLVLLPYFIGPEEYLRERNAPLVEWIHRMYVDRNAQVACLCSGVYLLAETGLLNGKRASAYWNDIDELKMLYPDVEWLPEKIITDEQGIYTSGGAISSLNLMFYIIEKFVDKEKAYFLSRLFEIPYPLSTSDPFIIFRNQKTHDDLSVLTVQRYMEQNMTLELNADVLAAQVNMSKRNFIRRFKVATQSTPGKYLQQLRMEKAKHLFSTTDHSVSRVMNDVGYNDLNSFRFAFHRYSGYTPFEYKRFFHDRSQSTH